MKRDLFFPLQGIAFVSGALYGVWSKARASRSLRGKVVVITGGSRGLGLALARRYARLGAHLVLCSRTQAQLNRAQAELEARGAQVLALRCDVSDEEQVRELVRQAIDRFGHIDVLVNNAGIIQVGPFESMELDDFEAAMDSIFWGTLNTTLDLIPHLRRGGRIINITSIGAEVPVPHLLPYVAAKFAVRGLSEGLRVELAKSGIRVTTVIPGLMRTGSFINALFKGNRKREMDWFALGASLPMMTVSADRAASLIVSAGLRGQAVLTIGWPAKMLRLLHAWAPGVTMRLLSIGNQILPAAPAGAQDAPAERGELHQSDLTRSPMTALGRRAARRFNEAA